MPSRGRLAGQKFDCHEPLTYPYGCPKTSLAQALVLLAWCMSLLTLSSCYFLNARPIPGRNEGVRVFLGYGFMTLEGGGDNNDIFSSCGKYTDFEQDQHIDAAWRVATAFAFLPLMLGGVNCLVLLSTCCLVFHDNQIFKRLYYINMTCFVLQVLVFVGYANPKLCGGENTGDYICDWGSGSGLNLGAAIFWLLAAILCYLWPEPVLEPELEEPVPIEEKRPNYPKLTNGAPPPPPRPDHLRLTAPPPRKSDLPQITNGPRQKSNNKLLTNGQQPSSRQNLPQITNGRQPRSSTNNNNLRLTNGQPKKKRPSTRNNNLSITNGN